MIPPTRFALPGSLTNRERFAVRAWHDVHLDRLRHADQIGDREAVARQQVVLAVLAGLLAEGRCPNCRIQAPWNFGCCCEPCTDELRDIKEEAA